MAAIRWSTFIVAALLPLAAAAEEQGGARACRADVQKFCATASDKKECLIDHQKEISDDCYDALKAALLRERVEKSRRSEAAPIYKKRDSEGRIVYTNVPLAGAEEIPMDRVIEALPLRAAR